MKKNYEKAIELITEALEILNAEVAESEEETKASKKAPTKKTAKKTVEVEEDTDEETGEITAEELEAMSYNEIKAYAKEIGVKAVGSHKQILNAILKAMQPDDEEEEEEDEEPVKPTKNTKSKKAKKVVEPEPEEEDEEEEEDEDINAEIEDSIEYELGQMDVEELADILSEAGLSTKGKKEALIARIIKGIEDGKIELEEEEEDEDVEDADADEEEVEEYDVNDPENPDMTKARKKAIIALTKEIQASIKKKKLTVKEMTDYLLSVGYTKKELKDADADEITELYIGCNCMFIDDEGEEVEHETPYEVNGMPACCGKFLELEDDTYVCSVCGAEYEAEE